MSFSELFFFKLRQAESHIIFQHDEKLCQEQQLQRKIGLRTAAEGVEKRKKGKVLAKYTTKQPILVPNLLKLPCSSNTLPLLHTHDYCFTTFVIVGLISQ